MNQLSKENLSEQQELNENEPVEEVETDSETIEQVQQEKSESELEIERLQVENEGLRNRILRMQADYDNFRRRTNQEKASQEKYRAQNLISDILPALDNFERALSVEITEDSSKSLYDGVKMVHRQLVDALKNEGVEVIETVGQEFDPHLHQAVMQVEDENFESNVVVEELQKGYKLKDRILRPSMVKVNQ